MLSALAMTEFKGQFSAEWLMHYHVQHGELTSYYKKTLETKPSTIPSIEGSDKVVGEGLFSTVDIKKGDFICAMPGCWVTSRAAMSCNVQEQLPPDFYMFKLDNLSQCGLGYLTYPSQANKINSATFKDKVIITT